jgi:hypothetical protein
MKENKIITAEINQILPEPKLEKIRDKYKTIKCNSCLKDMVEIVEILEIKKEDKIKVFCSCGGASFVHKTEGKWMVRPLDLTISKVEHPYDDSEVTKIICK